MNKQPSTAEIARDRLAWCMVNDKGGRWARRKAEYLAYLQRDEVKRLLLGMQNAYPRGVYGGLP